MQKWQMNPSKSKIQFKYPKRNQTAKNKERNLLEKFVVSFVTVKNDQLPKTLVKEQKNKLRKSKVTEQASQIRLARLVQILHKRLLASP